MRRLLAVGLVLLLVAPFAFSQDMLMKGSWDLGGSFGFMTQSGDAHEFDEESKTTISFAPDLGYFVIDKLSIGLLFDYTSMTQGDYKDTFMTIGPRLTYYIPMEKGAPFVEVGYTMGTHNYEEPGIDEVTFEEIIEDGTNTTSMLHFGAGYLVPVNDHVALYGKLAYSMDTVELEFDDESRDGNTLAFKIGFKFFHFK